MARLVAVVLCILAFGCADPGREARKLGEKYPVSAEVTQLAETMKKLTADTASREALAREHSTWISSRAAHCLAMSKLQGTSGDASKKAEEDIGTCFAGADVQRADALRSSKLAALLEQPPVEPVKQLTTKLSIPFERGQGASDLRISPDGGLAVVGKVMGDLDVFDTRTAQILRVLRTGKYNYIGTVEFSPNGRVLFVSSTQHRGMKIYDPYTGELLREYDGLMGPFVLLPGGRYVLYADRQNLRLYDAIANKTLETPYAQRAHVWKIALSPDGKRAAVMSSDRQITLWDIGTAASGVTMSQGAHTEAEIHQSPLAALAFTRAADALIGTSHDGTLTRWSVPDLKRVQSTPMGRVAAAAFLRTGETNRFVVPGLDKDGQISHLLFWDLDRDVAATVPLTRLGNSIRIDWTKFAPFIYIASVAGLTAVDMPDEKAYRPSPEVIEPLLSASQQERKAAAARIPMLRGVADDARVEAVGVYGPRRASDTPVPGGATPAPVNIVVGKTDRPVVLVLSSYDPVRWVITQSPEARVRHILLAGGNDSIVVSKRAVEITRIEGVVAYQLNSPGYRGLEGVVREYLGKGFDRFQGSYTGVEFTVGATTGISSPPVPGTTYRCASAGGQISFMDRPCADMGLQDRGVLAPPPSRGAPVPRAVAGPQGSSRGVTIGPGPSPHERIIRCGGTTIVCDANDTVMCGGRQVPCK
jgi:WD40 repeat protein